MLFIFNEIFEYNFWVKMTSKMRHVTVYTNEFHTFTEDNFSENGTPLQTYCII